jgi:hypothetical protein
MHILILSGDGDIRQYIWDKGIGLKFYCCNSFDMTHYKQIPSELKLIEEYAYIHLKGLCFKTQRYEIIENIYNHFKNKGHKIEYLRIEKSGNIFVLQDEELGIALEQNWEIR